jgi:uncharacterized protein YggU (UPF0235/DUF167 family)
MSIQKFQERVELLKAEHGKANTQVSMLKEQLAKSEAHIHMVTGHLNEANFHLQQAVEEEAARQQAAGIIPPAPECVDGEAHVESAE